MARALWSGSISFGLVSVPVKMYTAVQSKDVSFNQIEAATGARIKQKRVSSVTGEEVAYSDIVKGFEVSENNYVIVTPQELDELDVKATKSIDIEQFVQLDEIDPMYFDHPYYLAPAKGGEKAYVLLRDALAAADKVAIGHVVIRTKQYLAAIRPVENALVLETMMFADEVVPQSDIDTLPDGVEVTEKEMAIASQLIDAQTEKFDASNFHNTFREKLTALIDAKAEGQQIVTAPVSDEPPAEVVDLMSALQASIAATKRRKDTA